MMGIFKRYLKKEVELEEISDYQLRTALDQIGRDLVYNYFLFGDDVTHEMFIENLKRYLNLNDYF